MRWLSFFSLFSLSSLLAIFIALVVIVCVYFGIIDKNGKTAHIANEIISNRSGVPIEEIEELEGIKKD